MERTAENIYNVFKDQFDPSPFTYEFEVNDLGTTFVTKVTFIYGGNYAGYCDITFSADEEIIITNHSMGETYQSKGSYKALCAAIPPVGRKFGYSKAVIAVPPQSQNGQLDDVHVRSGFTRVSNSAAEVDISQPNSKPQQYAKEE